MLTIEEIEKSLGAEADSLLNHVCKTIPKETLYLPSPDWTFRLLGHWKTVHRFYASCFDLCWVHDWIISRK